MKALDIMTSPVVTVDLDTPVLDIARLLLELGISAVPVVDAEGKAVGIVSEGDLMRRTELGTEKRRNWWLSLIGGEAKWSDQYARSHGRRARDVMSEKVVSVSEDTDIARIAELLEKHRIKRVPVIRDGKPVGVVSRANLLRAFAALQPHVPEIPADARALRKEVLRHIEESGAATYLLNVIVEGDRVQVWGLVNDESELKVVRIAAEQVVDASRLDYNVGIMPAQARSGV